MVQSFKLVIFMDKNVHEIYINLDLTKITNRAVIESEVRVLDGLSFPVLPVFP